jgi:hypothetical protein
MGQLTLNMSLGIDDDMKQLHEMNETERINSINRAIQKKVSQRLHKKLNAIGIKVQLKGLVNIRLQAVIQLPEGLWLLVDMDGLNPEFYISEDRDGFSYIYWYDDNEKLLLDEIKMILEETKNVL